MPTSATDPMIWKTSAIGASSMMCRQLIRNAEPRISPMRNGRNGYRPGCAPFGFGPVGEGYDGRLTRSWSHAGPGLPDRMTLPPRGPKDDTMEGMRARVLVVDDDPALAEMLGIVLRSEGFDTAFVRDGAKALAAFREAQPDLVLLDLMLPGMAGIDVCREIRAESGVPIVMLTAKTDTVDVVLGLESGRRRLRGQAVQAQGAGRPDPGPAAPGRRRRSAERLRVGRRRDRRARRTR